MISAAMRAFPKGGVKSFRSPTIAPAVVVGVQIHSEAPKVRAAVAAGSGAVAARGSESYYIPFRSVRVFNVPLAAAPSEDRAQSKGKSA